MKYNLGLLFSRSSANYRPANTNSCGTAKTLTLEASWERPIALWANTTLGLMLFWWAGSRQQQGRSVSTISALPGLRVIDARKLTDYQLDLASALLKEFRHRPFLPANEAYRDSTRRDLDSAVLVTLLGLPPDILDPLDNLRLQWCAEPSVHGGKGTKPPEAGATT